MKAGDHSELDKRVKQFCYHKTIEGVMGTPNEAKRPNKRMVSANFSQKLVKQKRVLPIYSKLNYKLATIGEFKRGKIPHLRS